MGKTGFLLPLMVVVLVPTFGVTLSADSPTNITTDQLALLALKSHVTHDPRNLLATNWSTTISVCNWIGVTCGSKHQRVTALDFTGMGLTGTIQPHLGNLSFLARLNIRNNNFHGPLPVDLANLRRLKHLNFGNNSFSGEIPSWFGSFTKLQSLFLYGNNFTGVIPSTLGNLSKLEILALFDNQLSGEISSIIGNLTSLKYLELSSNSLTGKIPSIIGHLTSLKELGLSSNYLTGKIPSIIGHLTSLKELGLSSNYLTGKISSIIGNLTSLEQLYLYSNNLIGKIPSVIGNLISLEGLDLSYNSLTGRIPTLPPSLFLFNVAENKLDGKIPSSICNLSSIEILYLSRNNLSGIIPECLGSLSHLEILFSKSCLLRSFHVDNNQLEGPIPQSLVNCKDLEVLDFGNNKLNGTFPSWLGNLKNLQILVLHSNRFYGHISNPEVASSFSHLRIIDLSNNDFNGCFPTKFFENLHAIINGSEKKGQAEYMRYGLSSLGMYYDESLFITTKGLKWEFKRILTILMVIDFSNNRFNGEIPEILGELGSLIVLNLSHNSLTGPMPSSLSNLSKLESLDLSSNKLQGRIPTQLVNLDFLQVLNLSCNNLKGLIPRSNHFDTFTNDSYSGNLGLCGFPLSKGCGNNKDLEPPPTKFDDTRREMNWKFSILMGSLREFSKNMLEGKSAEVEDENNTANAPSLRGVLAITILQGDVNFLPGQSLARFSAITLCRTQQWKFKYSPQHKLRHLKIQFTGLQAIIGADFSVPEFQLKSLHFRGKDQTVSSRNTASILTISSSQKLPIDQQLESPQHHKETEHAATEHILP
ncbi:hypothetical protein CRYUN_Cryun38cG0033400 [Craigia yunnanensis]